MQTPAERTKGTQNTEENIATFTALFKAAMRRSMIEKTPLFCRKGVSLGQADVTSARVEKIEEVVQSLQLNMVFSTPASEP